VRSKIDYMIYTELMKARDLGVLMFGHEKWLDLPFGNRIIPCRPDFMIEARGRTFYWEHLGMLDRQDYAGEWRERRRAYRDAMLEEALVTTDDSTGVSAQRIAAVVADLAGAEPAGRTDTLWSLHHYPL
jgi:exodeoxyribonuclease V alpha subunit